MNWLLQKEIRVNKGNLMISYPDYDNNWQKIIFPYIIVFKPINDKKGEIAISFYSSRIIKTPVPSDRFQWEGGMKELSPFILNIKGIVEKGDYDSYYWVGEPEIKAIFNEPVPDFNFPAPGFVEKIVNEIKSRLNIAKILLGKVQGQIEGIGKKTLPVVENAAQKAIDKIKSFFKNFNLFKATVVPETFLQTPELDLSQINLENLKFGKNIGRNSG